MTRPCGHEFLAPKGECDRCEADIEAAIVSIREREQPARTPKEPPSTKDSNPKDRAAATRLDLSLFPATARAYGALAFTEGDLKYGGYNWRVAGVKASVYYAAANRHLDKWFNGQEKDPKTGVPHLAYALACIAVLIDARHAGKDLFVDDRPPPVDMEYLFAASEDWVKILQEKFPNGPARHTHVANSGDPT
jgi:hypothetical protein